MAFLFFWCILLCAIDAIVVLTYQPEISESLTRKAWYYLGGATAFVYNLCFPWLIWFLQDEIRPALLGIYVLLNYCTLMRMTCVDKKGLISKAWGIREPRIPFSLRLKLEKCMAALFLAAFISLVYFFKIITPATTGLYLLPGLRFLPGLIFI